MRKSSISLSAEENTTQERRHLREDVPQMLKQQIPNHQLHKINQKTSLSMNSSHKTSLSLNSHKARPPLNNNHKAKQLTLSRLNPAMMINHFQIMLQLSELLRQKIPALYQRNQGIVYKQKQIIFNPFCLIIFSLQIKRKTSYILETHVL